MATQFERIQIDQITIDHDLQTRVITDRDTVAKYAALMSEGVEFDPIQLVWDGSTYYIRDGNHRVQAAIQAGLTDIAAVIEHGTKRHALWAALASNGRHGLSLNNADKHRIVMTILLDSEWSTMSDRQIVAHVGAVSQPFVSSRRKCIELIRHDDPQLTDSEILDAAGSYKITQELITSIRSDLKRPEPLLRKYAPGSYVKFNIKGQSYPLYIGVVLAQIKDMLQVDSFVRSGDSRETRMVNPERAGVPVDTDYLYTWVIITRRSHDDLLLIRWENHYLTFQSTNEMQGHRYNYKTTESWDTGLACRVSDEYVQWLGDRGRSYQIFAMDDLPARLAGIVSRAGRSKGGQMLYPPVSDNGYQSASPQPQPETPEATPDDQLHDSIKRTPIESQFAPGDEVEIVVKCSLATSDVHGRYSPSTRELLPGTRMQFVASWQQGKHLWSECNWAGSPTVVPINAIGRPRQQPETPAAPLRAHELPTYEAHVWGLCGIKPQYRLAADPSTGTLFDFYDAVHTNHKFGGKYVLLAKLSDSRYMARGESARTLAQYLPYSGDGDTYIFEGVTGTLLHSHGLVGLYYMIGGNRTVSEISRLARMTPPTATDSDNGYHYQRPIVAPESYDMFENRDQLILPHTNYDAMWDDVAAYLEDRDYFDNEQLEQTIAKLQDMLGIVLADWHETKRLSLAWLETQ